MNDYLTKEDFEQFKRFHKEQFELVGVQLVQMKNKLEGLSPSSPIAPQTRDLLARQVDRMFREIQFLQTKFKQLEKKLNIPQEKK